MIKSKGKINMNRDFAIMDAKDKIFYCYGRTLQDMESDCEISSVAGYRIIQEAYGDCQASIVKEVGEVSGERIVYIVPVTQNQSCIGRLEIYP